VDAKVEELAGKGKTTVNELYARLQRSGQLERIERELLEAKVFDLLSEQSEIRDAS
jgi:hypothetical protein